jgi:HD-like signal output (HDOD) protein
VNCIAFPEQFEATVSRASTEQTPLDEVERAAMGFTHCQTGEVLAHQWGLAEEIIEVVAHHHDTEPSEGTGGLVAIVHLSDLLCRMRGLGYGYYERQKVDMLSDPAWAILLKEHHDLDGVDLARFTFELDEAVGDIRDLVSIVFGSGQTETA